MLKKLRRKFRRTSNKILRWMRDPDLDVIGVGVLSLTAGRTMFFAASTAAFASAGLYLYAAAFASVIAIDVFIQLEVLAALRRLMRFEILRELAAPLAIPLPV